MNTRVHSFSVKTAEDAKFVDDVKKNVQRTGRSFSWHILKALKAIHAEEVANESKQRAN